jgi:RNA polymerase sigma factor (sigma-70 family)
VIAARRGGKPSPPPLRTPELAWGIALAHRNYVAWIARRMKRGGRWELDDMIQAGMIGAYHAALSYDTTRGVPYRAWARMAIRTEIRHAQRRMPLAPQIDYPEYELAPEPADRGRADAVAAAMDRLPDRDRKLLARTYGIGTDALPPARLASRYRKSKAWLGSERDAALARLRDILDTEIPE